MFRNITQIVKNKVFFNHSKWKRIALFCSKTLSASLRGITSKNLSEFYFLNSLHSFATENKQELHIKLCKNKDFSTVKMLSEDTKIS